MQVRRGERRHVGPRYLQLLFVFCFFFSHFCPLQKVMDDKWGGLGLLNWCMESSYISYLTTTTANRDYSRQHRTTFEDTTAWLGSYLPF